MPTTTTDLTTVLEELVSFVRLLPVEPAIGNTTASTLRIVLRDGPLRVSALAERLGVSQPGMTQLVDRLVAEGSAERIPDPTDRRATLVRITERGRALLRQRHEHRVETLDRLVARLDAADRRRIDAALPALERLTHLASA